MAPYSEGSYAEVLRWLENTEVQYVPHGKKQGTKSYDRYERYSQAKTVAEALEFGSLALDLVHDYQKGLLKRSGGPIRDRPLNMMEVKDHATLTKTDLSLARFGHLLNHNKDGEREGESSGIGAAVPAIGGLEAARQKMEQKDAFRKAKLSAKFGVSADTLAQKRPNKGTELKRAISFLGLQKPNKGTLLTKMLAMRTTARGRGAAAGGETSKTQVEGEGGAAQAVVPQLRRRGPRPLRDGLLARVQARRAAEAEGAAGAEARSEVAEAPMGAASSSSMALKPLLRSGASGGGVGKKLQGLSFGKVGRPASAFGTLLAKVHKKLQASGLPVPEVAAAPTKRAASAEAVAPRLPAAAAASGAEVMATPPRKRPKLFGSGPAVAAAAAGHPMDQSGRKPEAPAHLFRKVQEGAAATGEHGNTMKSSSFKESEVDYRCFLPMAEACSHLEAEPSALAEHLKRMTRCGAEAEDMIRATMVLAFPTSVVPGRVLAMAIEEEFGVSCSPNMLSEALAAKALESRQRKQGVGLSAPLTVSEVEKVLSSASNCETEEDEDRALQLLANLLGRTQPNMEPFYLVRALQGKLILNRECVQGALATALAGVRGR